MILNGLFIKRADERTHPRPDIELEECLLREL